MRAAERLMPSFGGVYYDRGRPIVRMTDHARQSPSQVAEQLQTSGMRLSGIAALGLEHADYRFSQLAAWRDALLEDFLGDTIAHSLDLDERRNRVVVEVTSASSAKVVEAWARGRGVPREALEIPVSARTVPAQPTLASQIRPLMGGLQIGPRGCTMTLIAEWNAEAVLMTNSHCSMNNFFWDQGTTSQPWGNYPWVNPLVPQFGSERYDWGGFRCGPVWSRKNCRYADLALYSITGATASHPDSIAVRGRIAALSIRNSGFLMSQYSVSPSIVLAPTSTPHFRVTSRQGWPFQGESLDKVGVTTGWTWGDVTETCVDIAPNAGNNNSGDERFLCQDRALLGARPGDSGSPVFKLGTAGSIDVTFYGMLWGMLPDGRSSFSSWSGIYNEIGATWKACAVGGPVPC
jgi:hypothetical protein